MVMSVSKQFTGALIARLVVKERLRFDDRVGVYLDDWPSAWGDVTIGNLLAHSSGLHIDTTYAWLVKHHPEYWAEPGVTPPAYQPRPLETPPGTTYNYANIGYTLLSMIAARAGGLLFDELMRREVFGPLGLRNTHPERDGRVPGRARGYARTGSGLALSEQKTIDIVGAGDSVTANLATALAAGAALGEALELANAAASVVIHQLGTTGVARVGDLEKVLFPPNQTEPVSLNTL